MRLLPVFAAAALATSCYAEAGTRVTHVDHVVEHRTVVEHKVTHKAEHKADRSRQHRPAHPRPAQEHHRNDRRHAEHRHGR